MSELETHAVGEAVYGRDDSFASLQDRLQSGRVPISVYGLDRTALPLAATVAATSGNVVATETDTELIEAVSRGESPYDETGGLNALVADTTATDDLAVTPSVAHAAESARVHIVRMSTPMDDGPDLSELRTTLGAIAGGLTPGDLVIVESTVPVGTCREGLYPLLIEESGLDPEEVGFAFTPERPPQHGLADLEDDHTRVIAGIDAGSEQTALTVYETLTGAAVTTVEDIETAEMATLMTAAYRTVTTALSNELARHAAGLDVDVAGAIDAVGQRADCQLPAPNLGVATCQHPGYIRMLRDDLGTDTRLLDAASVSNDLMTTHASIALLDALEQIDVAPAAGAVLVVGLDQRTGLGGDQVEPSLQISRLLAEEGLSVDVTGRTPVRADPYEDAGATVVDVETAFDRAYDAVVLAAPTIDPPDGQTMMTLATADHPLIVLDGYQLMTELRNDDRIIYRGIGINA